MTIQGGKGYFIKLIFLLIILCTAFHANYKQKDVVAYGCDNYGYLRQAELIRQNGFIGGFDSSLNQNQIRFLFETAKGAGLSSDDWDELVAPHCHHYVASSDKVILQYPIGTGMIMSFFPKDKSQPYILIIGVFLASLVFMISIKNMESETLPVISLVCFIFLFYYYLDSSRTYDSQSIVLTILLMPLLCFINNRALLAENKKWFYLIASGLLCGILFNVRVANIFSVIMSFLIIFSWNIFRFEIKNFFKNSSVWALCFFLTGIIPYSYYSWVNTGGLLNSTYSSHDQAVDIHNVPKALAFYFSDIYSSLSLCTCIILSLFTLWVARRKKDKILLAVALISIVMIFINLAFFSIHAVNNNYYLVPVSFMIIGTLAFQLSCKKVLKKTYLPVAFVAVLSIFLLSTVKNFVPYTHLPAWIDKNKIIWNYLATGTLDYYEGHAASKFLHSSPEIQMKIVGLVKEKGRDQVFINDFDTFRAACDRIAGKYGLYPAGYADLQGLKDIWLLKAKDNSSAQGLKSCDPNAVVFPAHEFNKVSLNINHADKVNGKLVLNVTLINHSAWPLFTGSPNHPINLSWQFAKPTDSDNVKQWSTRLEFPVEVYLDDGNSQTFNIEIPDAEGTAKVVSLSIVEEGYAWFHDFGFKPAIYSLEN